MSNKISRYMIVAVCVVGVIGLVTAGAIYWFSYMESSWVAKK
jgi:hypothetical protein